jgi:hypothetical protein
VLVVQTRASGGHYPATDEGERIYPEDSVNACVACDRFGEAQLESSWHGRGRTVRWLELADLAHIPRSRLFRQASDGGNPAKSGAAMLRFSPLRGAADDASKPHAKLHGPQGRVSPESKGSAQGNHQGRWIEGAR